MKQGAWSVRGRCAVVVRGAAASGTGGSVHLATYESTNSTLAVPCVVGHIVVVSAAHHHVVGRAACVKACVELLSTEETAKAGTLSAN